MPSLWSPLPPPWLRVQECHQPGGTTRMTKRGDPGSCSQATVSVSVMSCPGLAPLTLLPHTGENMVSPSLAKQCEVGDICNKTVLFTCSANDGLWQHRFILQVLKLPGKRLAVAVVPGTLMYITVCISVGES